MAADVMKGRVMPPAELLLLFVAGAGAGALNAIAGGGSFLSFPALVLTGAPPIIANATSTAALWPAMASSAIAYRRELGDQKKSLRWLAPLSLLGGLIGAVVLLKTPQKVFVGLLPALMFVAAFIFTFGERIRAAIKAPSGSVAVVATVQFCISVYGGYFGGGMGLMMLAAFTLLGLKDLHQMNALKAIAGILINGIALVAFIGDGVIDWPRLLPTVAGAVFGGFGGASLARKLPGGRVRPYVVVLAWGMTAWFAYQAIKAALPAQTS